MLFKMATEISHYNVAEKHMTKMSYTPANCLSRKVLPYQCMYRNFRKDETITILHLQWESPYLERCFYITYYQALEKAQQKFT